MKPFFTFLNANCSDDNFPGLIGLGRFKSNLSYPINLAISSIKSISLSKSCDLLGITATSQPYSLLFKVQPMSFNLSTISVSDIFLFSNGSLIINGPRILCIRFLRSLINISSFFIKFEVLIIGELIEKYSSKRLIDLVTALIVFFDEIPF